MLVSSVKLAARLSQSGEQSLGNCQGRLQSGGCRTGRAISRKAASREGTRPASAPPLQASALDEARERASNGPPTSPDANPRSPDFRLASYPRDAPGRTRASDTQRAANDARASPRFVDSYASAATSSSTVASTGMGAIRHPLYVWVLAATAKLLAGTRASCSDFRAGRQRVAPKVRRVATSG
jgi:hypothetical protein